MAKSPLAQTIAAAAAASEPEVTPIKTVGKFTFAITKNVEIPAVTTSRTPSQNELPFKEMFPQMGHKDHMFVPDSFWLGSKADGGREVDPKKFNAGYAKRKLRDSFNDWVEKDKDNRSHWKLLIVTRAAGANNGQFTEPGTSFWLIDSTKAEAPAEA